MTPRSSHSTAARFAPPRERFSALPAAGAWSVPPALPSEPAQSNKHEATTTRSSRASRALCSHGRGTSRVISSTVGTVGASTCCKKGIDTLLHAFALLGAHQPGLSLRMTGGGKDGARVQALLRARHPLTRALRQDPGPGLTKAGDGEANLLAGLSRSLFLPPGRRATEEQLHWSWRSAPRRE